MKNRTVVPFLLVLFFVAVFSIGGALGATTKWVDQTGGSDANDGNTEGTAYASLQFAIDNSTSGVDDSNRSIIHVKNGTYGQTGLTNAGGWGTAILVSGLNYITIQAVPGHEPVVKPVTAVEANIVSISIDNSTGVRIDNIDSDQTVSQFDNWHVRGSDELEVLNSEFEGGEDGIDFESGATDVLIENNLFHDITTGNGDEAIEIKDGSFFNIVVQDNDFINNYRHFRAETLAGQTITNIFLRRNLMNGTVSEEAIRLRNAAAGAVLDDVLVENNVILNNLQQGIYIDSGCANVTVQHNTFFNNDQEAAGNGEVRTNVFTADIVIKNNIMYGTGSNPAIETGAGSLPGEDYNLTFNTSDGGFAFGPNTLTGVDPKFVSTTAGSEDLHLAAGSPALESGVDLGVTDDKDKAVRPQPAATNPDRGAYEHGTMQLPMVGMLALGALFVLLAFVLARVVLRNVAVS